MLRVKAMVQMTYRNAPEENKGQIYFDVGDRFTMRKVDFPRALARRLVRKAHGKTPAEKPKKPQPGKKPPK